MTSESISAGSQPAIDIQCDACGRSTREFVDEEGLSA